MAEEGVERVETLGESAFDVVHSVEETGVFFDEAATDYLDGAGLADAAFVVAVDVGTHGELGLFFSGVEEFADVSFVLEGVSGTADGAGDGAGFDAVALDADEHFGGGADELLIAELHEEFVGAGVCLLHAAEKVGGFTGVRGTEGLAEDDFVVVTLAHAFAAGFDVGFVLGDGVVGGDGAWFEFGLARDLFAGAFEALGGDVAAFEVDA